MIVKFTLIYLGTRQKYMTFFEQNFQGKFDLHLWVQGYYKPLYVAQHPSHSCSSKPCPNLTRMTIHHQLDKEEKKTK